MWSGPRNLSTAMMYAFSSRGDCAVVDEPFYAAYLDRTALDHPLRREILASQPSDPDEVIGRLLGSIPGENPHYYQKHMCQHMLPGIDRSWLTQVRNVFLIRHPARVVASFSAKYEKPQPDDLGFRQQAELFEQVQSSGGAPIVLDSADIRDDPRRMLRLLCETLGLDWRESMLHWPKGGHPDDGVWASHWYGAVHRSTGFAGAEGEIPALDKEYAALSETLMPYYDALYGHRLA
jgi:hypothetical protein